MERIASPSNYPPSVGKFRPEQIAHRATWSAVPDRATTAASMHVIRVRPESSTTVTQLNPLDPGTVAPAGDGDTTDHDTYLGWLERPGSEAPVIPARFGR